MKVVRHYKYVLYHNNHYAGYFMVNERIEYDVNTIGKHICNDIQWEG